MVTSEMTIRDAVMRVQGLQRLAERNLPVRVAYWLSRIIKALAEETSSYEEMRLKLAQSYCEKDEKEVPLTSDGVFQFSPENRAAFEKEHAELMTTTITVQAGVIRLEDFKEIEVSAKELLALGDFLTE